MRFTTIMQERIDIEIRNLQYQLDQQIVNAALYAPYPTHKEEGVRTMEVGKIVIREAQHDQYSGTKKEFLAVDIGGSCIVLRAEQAITERERMYGIKPVSLSAEQALELGQVLLKAAEILPEYRDAINKLTEERTKIEARYKDMISGLGLDSEVDVLDERGTFKVIEAST